MLLSRSPVASSLRLRYKLVGWGFKGVEIGFLSFLSGLAVCITRDSQSVEKRRRRPDSVSEEPH